MGLLQNKTITAQYPLTQSGGVSAQSRPRFRNETGTQLNLYAGEADFSEAASVPVGYTVGTSWWPARGDGGMAVSADSADGLAGSCEVLGYQWQNATHDPLDAVLVLVDGPNLAGGLYANTDSPNTIAGAGAVTCDITAKGNFTITIPGSGSITTANLNALVGILATIPGTGTITTANLNAVVDIGATLTGSGTISNAGLALIVLAVATLSGSGSVSGSMSSLLAATAALSGSGSISGANLKGVGNLNSTLAGTSTTVAALRSIANMVATVIGTSDFDADIRADAFIEAEVSTLSELSPEALAAAVWNALASDFNTALTMGERMNDAGAGGDPWATDISSGYTGTQAGKKLKDALTTGKFIGLK